MTQFTIEVEGLERLERELRDVLNPARELITTLTEFAHQKTREGSKPHAGDVGAFQRGDQIRSQVSGPGTPPAETEGRVYSNSPIVAEVDRGRSPGRRPPIKALARWAGRHGIPEERGFYIARAIGRQGSQPVHFFEDALEATRDRADGFIDSAARAIERGWGS